MVSPRLFCDGQKGFAHVLLLLAGVGVLAFLGVVYMAPFKDGQLASIFPKQFSFAAADSISNVTTNLASYPNGQVPKYEKFELTFDATTTAENMFYPYDASPPPGVSIGVGVTINGEFTQDGFATKATIPAFYYQDFDYQVKNNKDWIYPKNEFKWKVRFAPPKTGSWQYRLTITDSSGTFTTQPQSFTVSDSANKGFIKVSDKDKRYFEYEDGTYFPASGYNMNFDRIAWDDPVQRNKANFQIMGQNGPLLIRHWLSQWGIWSANVSPWRSLSLGSEADSMSTRPAEADGGRTSVMEIKWPVDQSVWPGNPCMSLGWMHETPAVKPNTNYQISITYKIPENLTGPNVAGQPYGLVAKTGGWLAGSAVRLPAGTTWRANQECAYPAEIVTQLNPALNERILTPYVTNATNGWATINGNFTSSGSGNYLPMLYLALENVTGSSGSDSTAVALIDEVLIREDLGNGQFGPNIVSKASMDVLTYADQKYSYAFDLMLDQAKQNNVYLKLVGLEKNESTQNSIDFNGVGGAAFNNNNFYGNYASGTKVRWLQQAWWRYMQARWGYSTNIHSWELLNEGDPFSGRHYTQANEFGKYMKQFGNKHLVTTSTWHSFPYTFWGNNTSFPNIDYGDLHQYMIENQTANLRTDNPLGSTINTFQPSDWLDSAEAVNRLSLAIGAKRPQGINKPTMRGETGFVINNADGWNNIIRNDTTGKWLHKFLWAGLNSGGIVESYWYDTSHIYPAGSDKRPIFGKVNNFLKDIPLSNGNYTEASASATNPNLRMMGQKDTVNKRAHLWIDNKTDTWGNLVNGVAVINIASATVTIPNMPSGSYPVAWIDTSTGLVSKNETVVVGANGNLELSITNLSTDTAVKIGDYSTSPNPSPSSSSAASTPPTKPGDIDGNNEVDIFDYNILLTDFGKTGNNPGDIDKSGMVDIFDYNILLTNFGQ